MSKKNNKAAASVDIFVLILRLNGAKELKDRKGLLDTVETIKSDKDLLDFFVPETLDKIVRESETWDEENDKIYNTPWTKEYVMESSLEIFRVLMVKEDYKKIRELVAYMKSLGIEDKNKVFPTMLEAADVIEDNYGPDANTLS